MKTIFLTSSPTGPLDGSRQVYGLDNMNYFTDNLKAVWRDNSSVLMIASAPDDSGRNDEMIRFFREAFEKSGFSLSSFDMLDSRNRDLSTKAILSYDVIILSGGHVPTQNRFFEEIRLRDRLKDFSGIIIGISAGSMNSADVVYAQPELGGESLDPDYVRFLPGLRLTDRMILPHYQMVKDNYLDGRRLIEDITFEDSYGKCFLVLSDGSYYMIKNGYEYVCGEAWKISDGELEKINENWEILEIS